MIKEFRLPDLGEGLTESEIVSWHVAVGDAVELNQIIADVETAKAVVELPSPYTGTVARLHQQPGTVVEVGAPIISFDVAAPSGDAAPSGEAAPPADGGNGGGDMAPSGEAAPPADGGNGGAPPARREVILVGYGAAVEAGGRPVRRRRRRDDIDGGSPVHVQAAQGLQAQDERPRSTPPVRKLARDLDVDLATVTGTGPGGLIVREDVLRASGNLFVPQGSITPHAGAGPRETRTPIKGVRKHTAAAMVASAFTAPHVTEFLTVDVTPAIELIERLKGSRAFAGTRVTPLALVAKALCIAVARTPAVNTRWDGDAGDIVQYHYVNLGIAAATPRGLLVPNIKDAHTLELAELAEALAELTDTAKAGRTGPEELAGGTISISNVGVFGIDAGTPILNPGEAAILAMGAVRRTPWEHRGGIALRSVMTLSLSFDHRLVDGEQGSRFLTDIGSILSDPGMVLTMV